MFREERSKTRIAESKQKPKQKQPAREGKKTHTHTQKESAKNLFYGNRLAVVEKMHLYVNIHPLMHKSCTYLCVKLSAWHQILECWSNCCFCCLKFRQLNGMSEKSMYTYFGIKTANRTPNTYTLMEFTEQLLRPNAVLHNYFRSLAH